MYEDYRARDRDRNRRADERSRDRDRDRDGDYRRGSSRKDYHSRRPGTLDYDDHDHERDEYGGERERGYFGGRGQPSKNVVVMGLPEDAKERDILYGLDYLTRDRHFADEQVRVARLRYDGSGRRIAVVEFRRRADAEAFVDRYYPEVSFPLEHSRGVDSEPLTFRIGFDQGEEQKEKREDEDWDCVRCGAINYPHRAVCYKCKADRPEDGGYGQDYSTGPVLTGETDEDPQQMPSQYIVVRNLEPSVTEQILATGVMKLFLDTSSDKSKDAPTSANKLKSTAPTGGTAGLGAKPGSLRRVFLMRDRRTNESWRYGFAEFATVDDAKAAVAKYRASTRFTIASRPVAVAFIHTGVFVPELDPEAAAHPTFAFTPIYNTALRLKYWDERAFPNVLVVTTDPIPDAGSPDKPGNTDEASKNAQKMAAAKKAKKDKDSAAATKIAMMPQMQMWAKKSAELHGVKQRPVDAPAVEDEAPAAVPTTTKREDVETQPDGPLHPHSTDSYTSYADWARLTCLLCDWEVPGQDRIDSNGYAHYSRSDILIDHEVRVHNHYKDSETRDKAAAKLASLGQEPRLINRRKPRLQSEPPPVYVSYADFDQLCCHLCSRKFKHAQTIWRHEQESELHKRMLTNAKNKERAAAELNEKGKKLITMVPDSKLTAQQNRYRDRALERRQAFRQPSRPQPPSVTTKAEKRKEPAAPTEVEETPAKKSKGAGMLAKMGWTSGVGLGAEGTGRTEAITTEAYAPGVGLGAEGGKLGDANEEAARKTRGDFKAFVEKTKDRARERYEQL